MKTLFTLFACLPLFAFAQINVTEQRYKFDQPVFRPLLDNGMLRDEPEVGSEIIATIPAGKTVKLLGLYDGYYRARSGNNLGFLHFRHIDGDIQTFSKVDYPTAGPKNNYNFKDDPDDIVQYGKVNINAPIRRAPSYLADTIHTLKSGNVAKMSHYNNTYWMVYFKDHVGYLEKTFVVKPCKTYKEAQESIGLTYAGKTTEQLFQETDAISREANRVLKQANRMKLYRGPRGGCYYITSSGRKEYVDRSLCN